MLHWSGRRFMYEELARFQNLRQDRLWTGKPTESAEMVGDAVPAVPFSAILKAVATTLKETDDGTGTISRSRSDDPFAFVPPTKPSVFLQHRHVSAISDSAPPASAPRSNVSKKRSALSHSNEGPQKKRNIGI